MIEQWSFKDEIVRHGLKKLALGIGNSLLTGFGFAGLWWAPAQWAQAQERYNEQPRGIERRD
jgi:hypothetical protein